LTGVGKTSLIKSIVQACEDIVHVDPLSATSPSASISIKNRKAKRPGRGDDSSTKQITEVYASTRPYPSWWSEVEESRVLRRRKSHGDTVLERNICFVDTPGYRIGTSLMESMEPVVRYIQSQMDLTAAAMEMKDGDVLGLLSGNGGTQVDVVLYMIQNSKEPPIIVV
jgi:hypothetical protein